MTTRPLPVRLLTGLAGLGLAAASAMALIVPDPAAAAPTGGDGSDWGAQGALSSDSAVTVHWDNTGTPPSTSVVERDSQQKLLHTDGKTYASVAKSIREAYNSAFGSGNGLGGLTVTVSQTEDLVNQGITVDISGAAGGTAIAGGNGTSFQIFQCWGAMGADGAPQADATNPDPATCQTGVGGPDAGSFARTDRRVDGDAAMLRGADWAAYSGAGTEVPFLSITGEEAPRTSLNGNDFFSSTTTNEWSHAVADSRGNAVRSFEVQTGTESSGLGCGQRSEAPSTPTCWLVVVPRLVDNTIGDSAMGPLAPSIWAQRLQVQLTFQSATTGCPSGKVSLLTGGSESLGDAAASWRAGLCAAEGIALGYTKLGDAVARGQYATGASDATLTTQPVTGAASVHVPLALTAPVVGISVDYQPGCDASASMDITTVTTEAGALACGYASLSDLHADLLKAGTQITDLRLNARLVAKLVTASYRRGTMPKVGDKGAVGSIFSLDQMPDSLFDDPEFRALNPQLSHMTTGGIGPRAVVEAMRSDGSATVWRWILDDPEAAAFLEGCPDQWHHTINPFYSTRTYAGCSGQATALEAAAAALRDSVPHPNGYADQPLSYPPDGSPFPVPSYYEQPATKVGALRSQTDFAPPVDNLSVAARDAMLGTIPTNATWCATAFDRTCLPEPGKWVDPKVRQPYGARGVLVLTDSGSAARYRVPTARLCDDDGKHCVAATSSSLRVAAGQFEQSPVSGVMQPGDADYADGAYPLTMPIYVAVRPTLPQGERENYATALTYLTTTGQTPGLEAGDLAPGYAPLTKALAAQATAAIAALRAGVATPGDDAGGTPSSGATAKSDTAPSSPATATPSAAGAGGGGVAAPPGDGVPSGAVAPAGGTTLTATPGALAPAAAGTESWPQYTLPLGVAIALLAGLSGPLMRTRSRWKVTR